MEKLYYCLDCKRILATSEECTYCKSKSVKDLIKKSPVNVIGSKIKGRILKVKDGLAEIIFIDQNKASVIKEYEPSKLRKIL